MTSQEFYGDAYPLMKKAEQALLEMISQYPASTPEDVQTIRDIIKRDP